MPVFPAILFFCMMFSGVVLYAEMPLDVKVSSIKTSFIYPKQFRLPVSEKQKKLEKQLLPIARRHVAFEVFEKECRQILNIPQSTDEECLVLNEIELKPLQVSSNEDILHSYASYIAQWFDKGYMVSGTQILPVSVFLRRFYDNHKINQKQCKYDIDDLSVKTPVGTSNKQEIIVRVTAEGEGDTKIKALRAAIKEALGRVNSYWSNRIESSVTVENEKHFSKDSETTIIIYGANIRYYDVISSVKTSEGRYKVTISAEIEKNNNTSVSQNIKQAGLLTEYIRIKNEYNAVTYIQHLLHNIPTGIIDVFHEERIPELNQIKVNSTLSINIAEYRKWISQLRKILVKIAITETTFATDGHQLQTFFENKSSAQYQESACIFVGDFIGNGRSTLQFVNKPEALFYRKYELRKNLLNKIINGFTCKPEVIVEFIDDNEKLLLRQSVKLSDLGIYFLTGMPTEVPGKKDNSSDLLSVQHLLLRPLFYDKSGENGVLKFNLLMDLQLSANLFQKEPQIRISIKMNNRVWNDLPVALKAETLTESKIWLNTDNLEKALQYYTPLAQKGDAKAIYCIGELYWKKKEWDNAKKWLKKNNDPESLYLLGNVYKELKDFPYASECYRKAADRGHIKAKICYGKELLKSNPVKGCSYLQQAAENGNSYACYYLANHYRKNGKWELAFNYYKKSMEKSKRFPHYSECSFYTGFCYANGLGVVANINDALFYLNCVAYGDEKFAEAQYLMGMLKKKTKRQEALEHFKMGAEQKHPGALREYGLARLRTAPQNALQCLYNSIALQNEQGFLIGRELLKLGYQDEARKMFEEYVKKEGANRAIALFYIGRICESAENKLVRKQALSYYQQAAKLNLPQAFYVLGTLELRSGNLEACHRLLKKATGYPPADFAHGKLHENKQFSGFSMREALVWYRKALTQSKITGEKSIEQETLKQIQRIKKQLQSVE